MEERSHKKISKSSSFSQNEMKEFMKSRDDYLNSGQISEKKLIKLQQTANLPSNIQVHIRVRPLIQSELKRSRIKFITVVNEKKVNCGVDREYNFENVYDENCSQAKIFENSIKGNIEKALHGYNFCVFAYGQTGSGKTYTMGTNFSKEPLHSKEIGIVPRSILFLFEKIKELSHDYDFKTKVSYLEIYNEEIRDLINVSMPSKAILVQEDIVGNVRVSGISECNILNTEDALNLLWTGNQNRKIAYTNINEFSSRSHSIYSIIIEKINKISKEKYTFKVNFVDLAGSERLKKTGATGDRFKEGVSINSGLLALSKVIMALTDKDKKNYPTTHIPYRDSKLTRLLKDSLSGNSITVMIGCISPSEYNLDETLNTLNYSSFARSVKIQPLLNVEVNDSELLKEEIKRLKEELEFLKTKSFELPDDKSIGSNNLMSSLKLNRVDFAENFMENSLNVDPNSHEDNNILKDFLRIKKENDDLKAKNLLLNKELENNINKENDIFKKLTIANDNEFDEEKLFALEINDLKDETFLLDENFNFKGFKSLRKNSTLDLLHEGNIMEFSLKKVLPKKEEEEEIRKSAKKETSSFENVKNVKNENIINNKSKTESFDSPGKTNSKLYKKPAKTEIRKNKQTLNNSSNDEKKTGMKKIKKLILNNNGNENIESTRTNNENSSCTNSLFDLPFKFDFETFKPSCSNVTNRSIVNETSNIHTLNNINELIKSLEEELNNKLEVEFNLSNLLKEKTQFLEMVKNHLDKIDENIMSLNKFHKTNENSFKNNIQKMDKENVNYNEKVRITGEKIESLKQRKEKLLKVKENTIKEIDNNELLYREEINLIKTKIEDIKHLLLNFNSKNDKTNSTIDFSTKSVINNNNDFLLNEISALKMDLKSKQNEINALLKETQFKNIKIAQLEGDLKEKVSQYEEKIFFLANEIKNLNNKQEKSHEKHIKIDSFSSVVIKPSSTRNINIYETIQKPRSPALSTSNDRRTMKNSFDIKKKEIKPNKFINVKPSRIMERGKNVFPLSFEPKQEKEVKVGKFLNVKKVLNKEFKLKSSSYSEN